MFRFFPPLTSTVIIELLSSLGFKVHQVVPLCDSSNPSQICLCSNFCLSQCSFTFAFVIICYFGIFSILAIVTMSFSHALSEQGVDSVATDVTDQRSSHPHTMSPPPYLEKTVRLSEVFLPTMCSTILSRQNGVKVW